MLRTRNRVLNGNLFLSALRISDEFSNGSPYIPVPYILTCFSLINTPVKSDLLIPLLGIKLTRKKRRPNVTAKITSMISTFGWVTL